MGGIGRARRLEALTSRVGRMGGVGEVTVVGQDKRLAARHPVGQGSIGYASGPRLNLSGPEKPFAGRN